jgi:peptidoglycan-N-acetylglucosamine deacetylase
MTAPSASPHAWAWLLALSQLLVAAVWWRWGWTLGLPLMLASHAPFWWGTLWPHSALFGPVLNRLPTDDRVVWLTIDDGPSDDTLALLDLLDAHDAKATFFLVGERAARHPGHVREILRRGHGIGNHSATHPAPWFWALGPVRMRREIADTQTILTGIAGEPPRWFRAVVGMSNPFVSAALKPHDLARVAWNARGFDGVEADPGAVVARIERSLSPGAIVLLHEGAPHGRNVEAISLLLKRLDALGYHTTLPKHV